MVPSLGFPIGQVRYVRAKRVAGRTKYPISRMLRLSLDSVTSFSPAPLRLATWLGMVSFLGCVLLMISGLVAYLNRVTVPGWTSLYVAVLLLGGVQLICLGLLGEYLGRIYEATQNRPPYLIAYDTAATPAAAIATATATPNSTAATPDVAATNGILSASHG